MILTLKSIEDQRKAVGRTVRVHAVVANVGRLLTRLNVGG